MLRCMRFCLNGLRHVRPYRKNARYVDSKIPTDRQMYQCESNRYFSDLPPGAGHVESRVY